MCWERLLYFLLLATITVRLLEVLIEMKFPIDTISLQMGAPLEKEKDETIGGFYPNKRSIGENELKRELL